MNRRLFITTLAVLVAAPVLADDTVAAKKAIQAQYDTESAAMGKKSLKGALAVNLPEFTSIDGKGKKRSLAEYEQELAQAISLAQSITVKTTVAAVKLKGDTAVVTAKDTSKIVLINPQTQKKVIIEGTTTNEDTWVKKSGKWLRKSNKNLAEKILMDGKPLPKGAG